MNTDLGARNELHAAALAATCRGWHVFPVHPGDKRPALSRDWEGRATTDPARIGRCWRHGPYNIGLACGPSRLVVIDLDTPKPGDTPPQEWAQEGVNDGADVLAVLCERHGQAMPWDTFTVRTASGGLHLYFTAPSGPPPGNSAGRLGWLIDTRGRGGYVVAPGSQVDGRRYEVTNPAPAAPLPDWLAALLAPSPRTEYAAGALWDLLDTGGSQVAGYAMAALRGELDKVLAAQEGSHRRNNTLNRAAFALGQLAGAGVLPRRLAEDALLLAGQQIGLSAAECERTIASGLDGGARSPRGRAA